MPNYVSQQSYYNRMRAGISPASIFGFDPEKYEQYFEPYENIKPELEFIRRQSELARQGIGLQKQGAEQSFQSQRQSGTSSLFDLIQQAQGLRGRSGFGAFGAAEKVMSTNADRLRKALESGVSQYGTQMQGYGLAEQRAGLAEERDIYGTQRSFYQDAIRAAMDLLQSGAAPMTTESNNSDTYYDNYDTGEPYYDEKPGSPINYEGISTSDAKSYDNYIHRQREQQAEQGYTGVGTGEANLGEYLASLLESGKITQRDYDWLVRQWYLNQWGNNDIGTVDYLIQEMTSGDPFSYQDYGG